MTLSSDEFINGIYGKRVIVKLNSGVVYKGTLTALDGNMNIAMEESVEYFPNGEQGERYGDAFIRGNNGKYYDHYNVHQSDDLYASVVYHASIN